MTGRILRNDAGEGFDEAQAILVRPELRRIEEEQIGQVQPLFRRSDRFGR